MIEKLLKQTNIDLKFLTKVLFGLIAVYGLIILINLYYTQQIYSKIVEKIDNQKVLVIDNNGNQVFEKIGNINLDTLSLFVRQSTRRIFEMSYDNQFAMFYAKQYTSKDVYETFKKRYDEVKDKMVIENGYYIFDIEDVEMIKNDIKNNIYVFSMKVSLMYMYDGGREESDKQIEVVVEQEQELENNYLGLLITKISEVEITEK